MMTVEENSFFAVYWLFIGGRVGDGIATVGAVVYVKKYRE